MSVYLQEKLYGYKYYIFNTLYIYYYYNNIYKYLIFATILPLLAMFDRMPTLPVVNYGYCYALPPSEQCSAHESSYQCNKF